MPKSPDAWIAWWNEQTRAQEAGEEISPPWVSFPETEPWSACYRQGGCEAWLTSVWLPFWSGLGHDRQAEYVDRWNVPDEWREYLMDPDRYFGRS